MGAQADRKDARTDIVARLKASATVTAVVPAASIFDSRTTTTVPVGSLPMINVFAPATLERRRGAPIFFDVTHDLVIECFETQAASGDAGADDAALAGKVDDLAELVQQALFTDPGSSPPTTPEVPAFLSQYEAVDVVRAEIILEGSGDGRKGLCRMLLELKHTAQYDPADLDDLKDITIDVDQLEGDPLAPDGDIDAELDLEDLDA